MSLAALINTETITTQFRECRDPCWPVSDRRCCCFVTTTHHRNLLFFPSREHRSLPASSFRGITLIAANVTRSLWDEWWGEAKGRSCGSSDHWQCVLVEKRANNLSGRLSVYREQVFVYVYYHYVTVDRLCYSLARASLSKLAIVCRQWGYWWV